MHAKQRGIEFSLSKEDYFSLILGASCTYCGVRVRTGGGVDRLDSDGSYKVGNLVACCGVCNALKLDILTPAQMFEVGLLLRKWREDGTLNIPKRFAETRDMPWADPRA